ncbi:MAG: DUF4136 domain-containing protein [Psychromonas sp.]
MKKMLLVISFLSTIFVLSGCTSSLEKEVEIEQGKLLQEHKARRMTVVSSAKPADVLPAFTSFTWSEEYSYVLSAINDHSEKDIQKYIRDEIIIYLKTKGYVYQADPRQADVVIGFLFALENDFADQQIQEKFGLLPGISSQGITDIRYEKGTLLLTVLNAQLTNIYWRSAMQGFVDFEKGRADDRLNYMQHVLGMMMYGFPQAGQ